MTTRYAFGPFILDVGNAELTRDGHVVKLAPQPYTALHLLVSRAGTLITREEFRSALWGVDSFVDFNSGLNFCMAQLRATLDDRAASSTYIATVPRRGYKFVAPVQTTAAVAVEPTNPDDGDALQPSVVPPGLLESARVTPRGWLRTASVAVAGVALGVFSVIAWVSASGPASAGPVGGARRLLATEKFAHGALALADAGPSELPVRMQYFQAAIAADPGYADAYAALAHAKLIAGNYRVERPAVAYAAAKAAAAHALTLDSGLAEAHAAFGAATMYFDWDWVVAGRHFARALAIDEGLVRAHQLYSRYLSAMGRHDEAVAHADRAVQLAPASASAMTDLGLAAFFAGRWEVAIESCDEAARLLPQFLPAYRCSASAAAEAGSLGLASQYTARTLHISGDAVRAAAVMNDGPAFWVRKAERLEAQVRDDDYTAPAFGFAVAQAHLGNHDAAVAILDRATSKRHDTVLFTAVHPAFTPLRDDPRFQALLRRIGLTTR